jgi:hypothetical protein
LIEYGYFGFVARDGGSDVSKMSMKIGIRAWIDFAFRKIFGKPGNEICLISLLNAVLQLPRPVVSVEYLNPFSSKDFETDKLVCVDVKATDDLAEFLLSKSRLWFIRVSPSGLSFMLARHIPISFVKARATAI